MTQELLFACLRSEPFLAQMRERAFQTLKNQADADDLVQQIALEALEKSGRMDRINDSESWLWHFYRFAHRDFRRERARRKSRLAVPLTEPVSSQNLERELIEKEERDYQRRRFQERFRKLTSRQQQVIRLLYVEDRNGKEVAAALGISYKAFRIAKDEALSYLRKK